MLLEASQSSLAAYSAVDNFPNSTKALSQNHQHSSFCVVTSLHHMRPMKTILLCPILKQMHMLSTFCLSNVSKSCPLIVEKSVTQNHLKGLKRQDCRRLSVGFGWGRVQILVIYFLVLLLHCWMKGAKESKSCPPILFLIFPLPQCQREAEKGGRGSTLAQDWSVACWTSLPPSVSAAGSQIDAGGFGEELQVLCLPCHYLSPCWAQGNPQDKLGLLKLSRPDQGSHSPACPGMRGPAPLPAHSRHCLGGTARSSAQFRSEHK